MDFDIDLTGYRLYGFGDFNQLGYKITPLAQLYFTIIQLDEEWIDEKHTVDNCFVSSKRK